MGNTHPTNKIATTSQHKNMWHIKLQPAEKLTQSWTPRASFNPYVSPEYIPAASPADVNVNDSCSMSKGEIDMRFMNAILWVNVTFTKR